MKKKKDKNTTSNTWSYKINNSALWSCIILKNIDIESDLIGIRGKKPFVPVISNL